MGTTDTHNTIALNLPLLIRNKLRGRDWQLHQRVETFRRNQQNLWVLQPPIKPLNSFTHLYKDVQWEVIAQNPDATPGR